jgi:hypothetical protein
VLNDDALIFRYYGTNLFRQYDFDMGSYLTLDMFSLKRQIAPYDVSHS